MNKGNIRESQVIYAYGILQGAQEEYEESLSWYWYRSVSAAANFEIEVDQAIETICIDPYLFKKTYQGYRELPLHKYPFTIVHDTDEMKQRVNIFAIYHQSRFPKTKYRKP
jgi:plasmid stabilization system protein ParE